MMFKTNLNNWSATRLGLILLGLALVAGVVVMGAKGGDQKAAKKQPHKKDNLSATFDLLIDDKETKELMEKYLNVVPMTHKSRKHAQRCFIMDMLAGALGGGGDGGGAHISGHIGGHMSGHVSGNLRLHKTSSSKNESTTTTTKTVTRSPPAANSNGGLLKQVMSLIFAHGQRLKKDSCPACSECPKKPRKCIPCPKRDCKAESACAPCPLPNYCRPAIGKEKCPPKPMCNVCSSGTGKNGAGSSTFTASENTTTTYTSSSAPNGFPSKPRTTKKPTKKTGAAKTSTTKSPEQANEPPADILNTLKLLLMNEAAMSQNETTTTTVTSSSSYNETLTQSSDGEDLRISSDGHITTSASTTQAPSTTGKPATTSKPTTTTPTSATSKKPKSTTGKPSTTTTTEAPDEDEDEPDATTTTTTTTTTIKPSSSKKPTTRKPAIGEGVFVNGVMRIEGKSTQTTSTQSSSTQSKDGHTSTNTSTTSTSTTGSFLFEKNIRLVVSNDTIREHILKMIEEIPNNTGGEEMKLAQKLLERFGEKRVHLDTTKKKGSLRSFTFMKAKTNFKDILGHLMERFTRQKCECPQCSILKTCPDCPKLKEAEKECPARKPNYKCSPCPKDISCPAPEGCPTYPACKSCPQPAEDPDDDGPLEELDDMDTNNTLKKGELKKSIKCAKDGFTCPFEKTCGQAGLNPLTPKKSQQGYMNGGEDEVYGEWPHFASIKIGIQGGLSGLCGGVLISNRHVLTAGHCVFQPNDDGSTGTLLDADKFKVTLGEHDKSKKDEHEESFKVSKLCPAKKFHHDENHGSVYDYAIMTLDKNVTFNDHIQPACLPYSALDLNSRSKCYVVGLGVTKMRASGAPNFAKVVQKMRVERASCKKWGIKHDDRSRHCFTKANAKGDTCGGDSGGPVVCLSRHNRWTLMGMVSYGSDLCDGTESSGWVGVYTRVQALLKSMHSDCTI